jgi:hypothetical protein
VSSRFLFEELPNRDVGVPRNQGLHNAQQD